MPKLSEVMGQQQAPPAQAAAPTAAPARMRLSQVMPEAVAPRADFSDVTASVSSSDQIGSPAPKQRTAAQAAARSVLGLGTRNVVEGAADLLGIFYDPIADAVNWVGEKGPTTSSLITGQPERYFPRQHRAREMSDMLLDGLGVPKPENAEERVAGDIGRGITGTALTMGAGGLIQGARGTAAAASNPSALSRLGDLLTAQPVQQTIASATGAGAAGIARENGVGPGGQALAGFLGALTPQGLAAAGAAGLRGLVRGSSGTGMQQVIDDFAAIGATPSVGQAAGNRTIQGAENILADMPTSAGVVTTFSEGQGDKIGTGLQRVADNLSKSADSTSAGKAIQRGIEGEGGFKERTKAVQAQLYDALDAQIDPATRVGVETTAKTLPEINPAIPGAPNLSPLFQNARIRGIEGALERDAWGADAVGTRPGMPDVVKEAGDTLKAQSDDIARINAETAAEIERKNVLRTSLGQKPIEFVPYPEMGKPEIDGEIKALLTGKADGQLPYQALKKLRTLVGQEIENAGLLSDVPRSKWRALYGALSQDMRAAAEAAGPKAVAAWTRANNYTSAMLNRMDAIAHVVDKNGGPEKVFEAAINGTREGATTLRQVMQSLPAEGQRAVTAAVIRRMGRAVANQQDVGGEIFSARTFMTNWNRLSPEAQATLFGRYGKEFSANMDRIARVADNIKKGANVYANPSGTANRAAALTYGGALVASMFDPSFATTGSLALGGVGANVVSRWLTNPSAVRWLARATALPRAGVLQAGIQMQKEGRANGDEDLVVLGKQLENPEQLQRGNGEAADGSN